MEKRKKAEITIFNFFESRATHMEGKWDGEIMLRSFVHLDRISSLKEQNKTFFVQEKEADIFSESNI